MTRLELAGIIWGSFATILGIIAALGWRESARTLVNLADRKAYWQHKAELQTAKASQRGRYARSCQMSQTRAKVLTKALQINAELGR